MPPAARCGPPGAARRGACIPAPGGPGVIAKRALAPAICRSHSCMSSNPPPTAKPRTRATRGFSMLRMTRNACVTTASYASICAGVERFSANSEISLPAQNARSPAPVRTTTRTPGSAERLSNDAARLCHAAREIALRRSGRLMVTRATCPSRPTRICLGSFMVSPVLRTGGTLPVRSLRRERGFEPSGWRTYATSACRQGCRTPRFPDMGAEGTNSVLRPALFVEKTSRRPAINAEASGGDTVHRRRGWKPRA